MAMIAAHSAPGPVRPEDAPWLDCDHEPIHVPGNIQSYGFLLALTTDWSVTHVSANVAKFTGSPAGEWLGQPADKLIATDALHTLRNLAATLQGVNAVQRVFALALIEGQAPFDVAIHRSGDAIVVEAEPAATDEREAASLARAMVARLKHSDGLAQFFRDGARHVQALTGFDRVMVYRFDSDHNGAVIAEALRGSRDSYLGLHYPASDIPAQARKLYLRSAFRIIADVASVPVPVLAAERHGAPLDQSLSVLRSVSPVHIEYLRNMDVAASLSISIVVDGKLWGLFACHHHAARLPSFAYRTAAELFGEMFSMMLEGRLRRAAIDDEARADTLGKLLVAEMDHDSKVLANTQRLHELIVDTIACDGFAVPDGATMLLSGITPDEVDCAAITAWLATRERDTVFASDSMVGDIPGAPAYADRVVGVLAIPMMRSRDDYMLLFRIEKTKTITWAGNPDKPAAGPASGNRLTPRQSFAAWAQRVEGRSDPFTPGERVAAETIRMAMLEGLLRQRGGTLPEVKVRSGQDMLIAELNHRVRNILALIRGLISQTRGSAETTEGFIETLDARVQSLARAHDQITSDRWGPAPLMDLIKTESDAYLGAKRDRVRLHGVNVLIRPAAFTTLALVFHELITNAAKYGALSNSGTVVIDWRLADDGDLLVDWAEQGGPDVAPPTRRGFGSTIIERSIPYDLGGTVAMDYRASGLVGQLCIPARHLAGLSAAGSSIRHDFAFDDTQLLAGLDVLLVEDSMIIAMDCADTLESLGAANVTTAATVGSALSAIATTKFQFALLDFNLGRETSITVADALARIGVPFAFATGYDGDINSMTHAEVPIIGKPYGRNQLVPVLMRLGFSEPR